MPRGDGCTNVGHWTKGVAKSFTITGSPPLFFLLVNLGWPSEDVRNRLKRREGEIVRYLWNVTNVPLGKCLTHENPRLPPPKGIIDRLTATLRQDVIDLVTSRQGLTTTLRGLQLTGHGRAHILEAKPPQGRPLRKRTR